MMMKEFDIDRYLFGSGADELTTREQEHITELLRHEIAEIFYGRNMAKGRGKG
jgi:S-adenosylmethionine decarboxylase